MRTIQIVFLLQVFVFLYTSTNAQVYDERNNYHLTPERLQGLSPESRIDNIAVGIKALVQFNVNYVYATVQALSAAPNPLNAVTQFGLKGDGVTDNTQALQRALDESYAQSRPLYLPAGVYLTGNIKVLHNISLFGDGVASVIRLKAGTPDKTALLYVENKKKGLGGDILIRDVAFDGNAEQNSTNQHNINLQVFKSSNICVRRVHFRGATEKNIELLGDTTVVIDSCTLDTCGRASVNSGGNVGVYLVDNILTGWSTQNLSAFPAYSCYSTNIKTFVYHNAFRNTVSSTEFSMEFFHYQTDDSVIIANNAFIHVADPNHAQPQSDTAYQNGGIGVSGVFSNAVIYANRFDNDGYHIGMRSGLELTCVNSVVLDNDITNGLILMAANRYFRNLSNNLIANNKVVLKRGVGAVYLIYSDNAIQDTVKDLTIYGNEFDFSENGFGHNAGIRFGLNSKVVLDNILIANNKINGNADATRGIKCPGVFFQPNSYFNARDIMIRDNTITNCSTGVQNNSDPQFHQNLSFVNNHFTKVQQSYDVKDGGILIK